MTKPPSKDHSDRPRPGGMREDGADERSFFADQPPEQPLRGKRQGGAGEKDTRHVHGHRDRLRARFRENGANALADYEILELLLFRLIPRRDTKPVAKALIDRFGSLGGVFGAPPELLQEVSGIGESVAFDLKLISALAQRSLKNTLKERQVLGSWSSVIDYCNAAMAHETREQFRILFLDKRNKLIADEIQGIGTVDHTPVYPREVVKRALELSATAIILVHNHPSGDPSPSRADIDMTHMIISSAKPLGITVHDHIIIGRDGYVSFKGLKLI